MDTPEELKVRRARMAAYDILPPRLRLFAAQTEISAMIVFGCWNSAGRDEDKALELLRRIILQISDLDSDEKLLVLREFDHARALEQWPETKISKSANNRGRHPLRLQGRGGSIR